MRHLSSLQSVCAMNITFLIGNGFDVNIGMNTRYCNFYEYYKNIPSDNNIISIMKEDIGKNIYCDWSDLEKALGVYTKNLNTKFEIDTILEDVCKNLSEYIQKEEEKYDFNKTNHARLIRDFAYPEEHLLLADKNIIKEYKNNWKGSHWYVNVVTFNYSRSLEKLMKIENFPHKLLTYSGSLQAMISSIKHIHGYADENMVLGVNDISQISNEKFRLDQDVLETIVKNECNKSLKHLVDKQCEDIVNKSDLICLFGLSLGDTDKNWWKLIGEKITKTNNCKLIIFWHETIFQQSYINKRGRKERELIDLFLSKAEIDREKVKDIQSKILIGYNTDIFKIELNELKSNQNTTKK